MHTPVLGLLQIATNMLVGVTKEGRIDYVSHYGRQQQAMHDSAEDYFRWQYSALNGRFESSPKSKDDKGDCDAEYERRRRYEHGYEFVDFSKNPSKFLVPGFFDTHIHASQFPNAGLGSELPLLEWLEKYTFRLENQFRAPDGELKIAKQKRLRMAHNVYSKVIARTLSAGTTTAAYFATIDVDTTNLLADLAVEKGQRALVGKVCMDCNPTFPEYMEESADVLVKTTEQVMEHCARLNASAQTGTGPKVVQGIVTPRFAPLCLRDLMKRLGALASKHGAPIQTHISENKDEVKLVGDLFPECGDYTSVYDSHGLLGPLTILAHAVHLTKEECKTILLKNCSILHCPSLNTFLTSGIAPVKRYLYEDKINVSLGTDVSGGCDHLILAAMKGLIMVLHNKSGFSKSRSSTDKNDQQEQQEQPEYSGNAASTQVTVADALYMATMGGAIACDMGKELGSFEMGKWFDAQLIDVLSPDLNIDIFDFQHPTADDDDMVEKIRQFIYRWVFCGDDRNCVKVWCNGQKVVDKEERWVYLG